VLQDLDFPSSLNPIVVSEEEGFEKPCPEIFFRAITQVNQKIERQGIIPIKPEECLHVGDELECDRIISSQHSFSMIRSSVVTTMARWLQE
jgi:FMN phosphatase YigB (HAD superfamily)